MTLYYPLHLDLGGKLCLVVGGGMVAERKVTGLLEAHARIRVVCLNATSGLQQMSSEQRIELILAPYEPDHFAGVCLAFAVTNHAEINACVAADAAARNVWVNRADAFESGDFIVPAVIRQGDLCISVSTGGNQPLLTARLAAELTARFGADYGAYVALLGRLRAEIKSRTESHDARRAAMQVLLDAEQPLRLYLANGDAQAAQEAAERLLARVFTETGGQDVNGDGTD
jgi:precorrin-2 dehydrogenase/sirohydrochlorin ferrochelatase